MNENKAVKGKLGKFLGGFGIGTIIVVIVSVVLLLIGGFASNETENWTLVQHPVAFGFGDPDVGAGKVIVENNKNPWILKLFGTKASYPDNVTEFFSDRDDEADGSGDSSDKSVTVVFKEKGKAFFSAQIVYETPIILADQLEFHKLARGDMKVVSKTVQTALNQSARFIAAGMTASEFFEGQESVVSNINELMKNNTLLKDKWKITIVDVQISNIEPDPKTLELFAKQQDALLNAKTAEANKEKFIQQEMETNANYANEIAKKRGEAEMVKAEQVTKAEMEAELATIEAQRKVDVATLAKAEAEEFKQKALIEANQQLEVAEIAKSEAIEKGQAIIVLAEAEEEKIRLAGAMTEQERVRLEIAKDRDVGVADAWANGNRLTPDFVIGGGGEGGSVGDINSTLFSMKLMESMGMLSNTNSIAK